MEQCKNLLLLLTALAFEGCARIFMTRLVRGSTDGAKRCFATARETLGGWRIENDHDPGCLWFTSVWCALSLRLRALSACEA